MTQKSSKELPYDLSLIRKVLWDKNIKQIDLATHWGVNKATVSRMLNGYSKISIDKFVTLAHLTGKPAEYFFTHNVGTQATKQ
jgi:plasmid maintenance system antidote protein VapI